MCMSRAIGSGCCNDAILATETTEYARWCVDRPQDATICGSELSLIASLGPNAKGLVAFASRRASELVARGGLLCVEILHRSSRPNTYDSDN